MGRINRPSLMVYGGTIRAGCSSAGEPLDIVSAFQSYGSGATRHRIVRFIAPDRAGRSCLPPCRSLAVSLRMVRCRRPPLGSEFVAGRIDEKRRFEMVRKSCPGPGAYAP
jgi:dihydroxy-acid dehydratase